MATSADEDIAVLKEKNKALAEKVQYWKMTAAQREEEKLDLMRELNHLRMTLSHYRTSNSALDLALDSAVQEFGENALTRLIEVSSSITRTVESVKTYINKKREIDRSSEISKPSLQDSPPSERRNKVLRVVPMIRGRSIGKPIILLRPIDAEVRDFRREERENTNQNEDTRSPRQHVMQDVYIPLRRIDAETLNTVNMRRRSRSSQPLDDESDTNADVADNTEPGLGVSDASDEDNQDEARDDDNISDDEDTYNRINLETLLEVTENDKWSPTVMLQRSDLSKSRSRSDDPLEGPSWLLDRQSQPSRPPSAPKASSSSALVLEPDSTTDNGLSANGTPIEPIAFSSPITLAPGPACESPGAVHTPTMRRRRRRRSRVSLGLIDEAWSSSSPVLSTMNVTLRRSRKNIKDPTKVVVMVAKMREEELENHRSASLHPESATRSRSEEQSLTPQRRDVKVASFDAPSPNGSTRDAGPIVMDSPEIFPGTNREARGGGPLQAKREPRFESSSRPRKAVKRERASSHDTSLDQLLRSRRSGRQSDRARSEEPHLGSQKIKRPKKSTEEGAGDRSRSIEDISGRSGSVCSEATSDRRASCERDSDAREQGIRPRRPRKGPQTYKEKPLNRKLRRQH